MGVAEEAYPGKIEAGILGECSGENIVVHFIPQVAAEEPMVVCKVTVKAR